MNTNHLTLQDFNNNLLKSFYIKPLSFNDALSVLNDNFNKSLISEELYEKAVSQLDTIVKARVVKYYKREGSPGNYKYYYTKEEYEKEKRGGDKNIEAISNLNDAIRKNKKKLSNAYNDEDSEEDVADLEQEIYDDFTTMHNLLAEKLGKNLGASEKLVKDVQENIHDEYFDGLEDFTELPSLRELHSKMKKEMVELMNEEESPSNKKKSGGEVAKYVSKKILEMNPESSKELRDEASGIIEGWYKEEGSSLKEIKGLDFEYDILDLLDAASDKDEIRIVKTACGFNDDDSESDED